MRKVAQSVVVAVASVLAGRAMAAPVPSDAELNAFGKAMQDTLRNGDVDAYVAMWDEAVLLDRVQANIDAPAALKKSYRDEISKQGLARRLAVPMIKTVKNHGTCTFLSLRDVNGEKRPVIRLADDTSFNYQELIVQRDAAGKLRAVDIYLYGIGETVGSMQRRIYLQAVSSKTDAFPPNLKVLQAMQAAIKADDFRGALAEFNKAAPELRKDRSIQFTRLQAALQSGDDEAYRAASEEYTKLFKDESATLLLSLQPLLNAKRFAEYSATLERLDKQVGGDPYLDINRGQAAAEQGDPAKAKRFYESALKREPQLFQAADILLTNALKDKDHAAAKKYLLHIERERPDFRFGDLKGVDLFADFVASPQYAEWQKERPKESK